MSTWGDATTGLVILPGGRRIRGRGLLSGPPDDAEAPELGVYLTASPHVEAWESRWISWPDFGLPDSSSDAVAVLRDAFERSASTRVEIVCDGGTGRTGTALAILARLAGVPGDDAVEWVRASYRAKAVETPQQRRFVADVEVEH